MEGRKSRRQNKSETKVKEEKVKKQNSDKNIVGIISKIITVILAVLVIAIFGIVIYLKVLPNKYLIPLSVIVIVAIVAGIFFVFKRKTPNKLKLVLSVISVILIAIFSFAGLKLVKMLNFLGDMTTTTVNSKTYSVLVTKDSKYAEMADLQYKLLLYYDTELGKNQEAIDKLNEVITIVVEKTDDVHELANKLLDKEVDAILIEDSYYDIIEEEILDFRTQTKVIYTFALEDVIETIAKEVSVTKEPFNIFISGIDSYGKISSVARSDVNMVVSVNPQTKQILLVNIPRDYYVKLHGTSGYRDKLTHAGVYGIDMSVKTIEDLFDIDINYYVRVNFTSLIDIIDAIGGVNVYSKYEFTSRVGNYHFKEGYNQMNGKQALGFARERYSFSEGDRMRGQNQQAVIDAMIKKVCSSSTLLTKFDSLLDSLKGSFQTNMEYTKMIELVRMQITDGSEWNVSSISVDGIGSKERTYSMGKTLLYVMIPYAGSVNQAESMLKSVLDGELLEAGSIDISKYNDYPVVSRGVYETEKNDKEDKEPEVEETPDSGTTTPEQTPDSGTTTPEQTPDSGTTTPEQTPDSGTTTPEQTPDSGTTTPEQTPDSGTTTPEQTPDSGTTAPEQTPDSGATTPEETPDSGTTAPEQTPSTEDTTQSTATGQ